MGAIFAADPDYLSIGVQILSVVATGIGSFFVGGYRMRKRVQNSKDDAQQKEREQVFTHFNELIGTVRNLNESQAVQITGLYGKIADLQIQHAEELAEARKDREECRVENAQIKIQIEHYKEEVADLKRDLREMQKNRRKDDDNG